MRNNRHNYGDQWKGDHPRNANSKERKTMNNSQSHLFSQNRNANNSRALEQKMTKKIIDVVLKNPKEPKRSSISTNLPPNQKTLLSTITSLMYSIDINFEQSFLDIELIMQILTFWGYPYHYNKTVFQPIGAQHTWHSCLQMMQFLAQLTQYHFEYMLQLSESYFEPTLVDYVLEAFSNNDNEILERWLDQELRKFKKEEQQLTEKIQTSALTLKNIKNSQKTISEMEEEEDKVKQMLNRQIQMVIELDQSNNFLQTQIASKQEKMEEFKLQNGFLDKKIVSLQFQLNHQQLNSEQARKIEMQIQSYRHDIDRITENHEKHMRENRKIEKNIIQQFFFFQNDVKDINQSRMQYNDILEEKNIDIPEVVVDHNSLNQFFSQTNEAIFQPKVKQIFQTEKVKRMLKGLEFFNNMLSIEDRQLNEDLRRMKIDNENENQEINQIMKQNDKLQKTIIIQESQIQRLKKIGFRLEEDGENLSRQGDNLESKIFYCIEKDEELSLETTERSKAMVEIMSEMKVFEEQSSKFFDIFQNLQDKMMGVLLDQSYAILGGFVDLNKQLKILENYIPSQRP